MHGTFVAFEEFRDCGVAFRDPSSFVEQICHRVKVGERQLDDAGPALLEQGERGVVRAAHLIVPEESPLGGSAHAHRQHGGRGANISTSMPREYGSSLSCRAVSSNTRYVGRGQREHRHAVERAARGTTPRVESAPTVGLKPTILLSPAGTRPEPAVSVPSAKETMPRAVATAEPDDEPPGTRRASIALRGTG
jgi:hypothetical protein